MNIIYLIIFCIVGFGALIFFGKYWKTTTLYALAIGCVVNANVFHAGNYPITVGSLTFGMNSVIYILFLFCMFLMFVEFGKKDTLTLMWSSVGAIFLVAFLDFLTNIASTGYSVSLWENVITLFASMLSTISASLVIIYFGEFLQNKKCNMFLNITLSILVSSAVDSIVYYGISGLGNLATFDSSFWLSLLALYLGKLIAIAFAILSYFLMTKVFVKKEKQENTLS